MKLSSFLPLGSFVCRVTEVVPVHKDEHCVIKCGIPADDGSWLNFGLYQRRTKDAVAADDVQAGTWLAIPAGGQLSTYRTPNKEQDGKFYTNISLTVPKADPNDRATWIEVLDNATDAETFSGFAKSGKPTAVAQNAEDAPEQE